MAEVTVNRKLLFVIKGDWQTLSVFPDKIVLEMNYSASAGSGE